MSTTATIAIRTRKETWFFYKHHDGYPDHTMTTLQAFLEDVQKNGTPATADEALARINQADNPRKDRDHRDDIQLDHTEPTTAATHIDGNGAEHQYLVDLTDQGATRPDPNKETPQDAAATKAGADLLRQAQDQRDEARRDRDHYRKELINALEDYRRAAAERNKHEDDQKEGEEDDE